MLLKCAAAPSCINHKFRLICNGTYCCNSNKARSIIFVRSWGTCILLLITYKQRDYRSKNVGFLGVDLARNVSRKLTDGVHLLCTL